MILETKVNNEYHENGLLRYTETISVICSLHLHLYNNIRISNDGKYWIRQGRNAKYFDNGQLAWELNYLPTGEAMKGKSNSYRKDGTIIEY